MPMTDTAQEIHPDLERVLITEDQIRTRVAELASEINADYAGRDLLVVGILKGSALFLADLIRRISLPCAVDFMCLSSYSGTNSTGQVRLLLDLRQSIEGKDVLVVEDIIDTGLTLSYLLHNLQLRGPRSLEVCAFLDKPDCHKIVIKAKYAGFRIPNHFVVGYGLDYNERYRNLPYVGVLKQP